MAKKTETPAQESKATKTRRYEAVEGGMKFLLPSGANVVVKWLDMSQAVLDGIMAYGAGQKYQDGAFARAKGDPAPTDEECLEFISGYTDGTLWDRSRGPGDGRPTLASVVRSAVVAKAKKAGEKLDSDGIKARIAEIMADETRLAKAKAALATQLAAWEALDI